MIYVVTRHAGAVKFLQSLGYSNAIVVSHADDDFFSLLNDGDIVVGTLPAHLMSRACAATGNPCGFLSVGVTQELRGKELTFEQMQEYNASVEWLNVSSGVAP